MKKVALLLVSVEGREVTGGMFQVADVSESDVALLPSWVCPRSVSGGCHFLGIEVESD